VQKAVEQGNAVDAFGPEPVRVSDARVGLGATDCCRSAPVSTYSDEVIMVDATQHKVLRSRDQQ
jgi:hypothetical protein